MSLRAVTRLPFRSAACRSAMRTSLRPAAPTAAYSTFSSRPTRPAQARAALRPMPFTQARNIFIKTEATPNQDSVKFLPGLPVMEEGFAEFLDLKSARASPLAQQLFSIPGVASVFYGPDFVTVSKKSETSWAELKPEIFAQIMEYFTAGHPLFYEGQKAASSSSNTEILDTDSETVAMIKELLDTRVRPALQEDGGDVEFRSFGEGEGGDGIVRLKLKGSCRGCDSSTITLKNGVERMLMHYIPEVLGVEPVLDPEEQIALDEFAKMESRINERRKEDDAGFSP